MELDLRSLLFGGLLVAVIAASVPVLFTRLGRYYPGVDDWAMGGVLFAGTILLFLLRDIIPDFFSVLLANILGVVSIMLFARGTARFVNRPFDARIPFGMIGIVTVLSLFFTYVRQDFGMRTVAISLTDAVLFLGMVYVLVRGTLPPFWFSHWFMASILLGSSIFLVFRTIVILSGTAVISFYQTVWIQSLTIFWMIAFTLFWAFGVAVMMTQRMAIDMQRVAEIDFLTGILNRRAGQARLEQEAARARRTGNPFSILLLDIDNFKAINDRCGHAVGDAALCTVTKILKRNLRTEDLLCRWGGDEFLIGVTDAEQAAQQLAERLLRAAPRAGIGCGFREIHPTLTIGISLFNIHCDSPEDCLAGADAALYDGKARGGNQVNISMRGVPQTNAP